MRLLAAMSCTIVMLSGCATAPAPEPPARAPVRLDLSQRDAAERQFRERALEAMRRSDYGEALVQWQIVQTLQPNSADVANQIRTIRTLIAETSATALATAEASRKRGDLDQAMLAYLRAVSVDRDNAVAAQGLREIERERVRRLYLTRAPRGINGATAPASTSISRKEPPAVEAALGDADQGALLYRQGDWAGASESLLRAVQKSPQDVSSRAYLADSYYQLAVASQNRNQKQDALFYFERAQAAGYSGMEAVNKSMRQLRTDLAAEYYRFGVEAYPKDPSKAIAYWEQSLRYDPANRDAAERLKNARRKSPSR